MQSINKPWAVSEGRETGGRDGPQDDRCRVGSLERHLHAFSGIVGQSAAIRRAIALAIQAGEADVTVLLEGETGTGKEIFARAIHDHHEPRRHGPFIPLNCAAVPDGLLESELFGHARGAFTGAERSRRGLFHEANGGTLFLDELADASQTLQSKLLRVLQDGEIRPVGCNRTSKPNVRVIAASNRDLRAAVSKGEFRPDLYYRLAVFPVRLPALRERSEDIPLLIQHFLEEFGRELGIHTPTLDPRCLEPMERYGWPGNVRELRNEILRQILSTPPGGRIDRDYLSPMITTETDALVVSRAQSLREIVREVERSTIRDRLHAHGYRRVAAARSLGVSREWLWAKMRRLGIEPPTRRMPG
jgi:transcriptional regulator with PAS, ATPase and Fis domain